MFSHDHDQREPLHRREVDPLVKGAGAHGSVSDVDQAHAGLLRHLEIEGDAGHDGNHGAERGDLTEEAALEIVEVNVEFSTRGRALGLRHVLAQYLEGRRPLHQHRTEVADQRREDVAGLQRVGTADRIRLLPQGPEQSANHLALAVQADQPLLERAGQAHPIIEFQQLRPGEPGRERCTVAGGCGGSHAIVPVGRGYLPTPSPSSTSAVITRIATGIA